MPTATKRKKTAAERLEHIEELLQLVVRQNEELMKTATLVNVRLSSAERPTPRQRTAKRR